MTLARLLAAFLCVWSLCGSAQIPSIPDTYEWTDAAAYSTDRSKVKEALKWLCKTPFGADLQLRSEASAYVLTWIAGCPDLEVMVETVYLPELVVNTEELFSCFIHGVALYQMEHPSEKDTLKLYTEGFKVLARLCDQSEKYSSERALRPLLRAYRHDRVKAYTQESFERAERK